MQQKTQLTKDIGPGFEQSRPHWWDLNVLQITQSLLKCSLNCENDFIFRTLKQSFKFIFLQWLHTKPRCQTEA